MKIDTSASYVDSSTMNGIESISFVVKASEITFTLVSSKILTRIIRASPAKSFRSVFSR